MKMYGCNNNQKQAYLIIAHKDDLTFRTLISMIDDKGNDIFVHMDLKNSTYDKKSVEESVQESHIYHTVRTAVTWGGVQPNQCGADFARKSH